jgi:predicted TIM-barrel fold metal-dependent hydrolase
MKRARQLCRAAAVICDAHVHLWPARTLHPDLIVVPGFTADPAALLAAMDAEGVRRAAVVTPGAMGWDNAYTLDAARAAPDRFVAVGRVDLTARDAAERLEREIAAGLAGVRIGPGLAADVLLAPPALAIWRLAKERRLPVHVHMGPDELERMGAVAERFPDMTLVVDHLGRPDVAAGPDGAGFRTVLAFARHPGAWIKTPAAYAFSRAGAPYRDLEPFLEAALEAYGADRLLWGSDWPACTVDGAYADAMEPVRSAGFLNAADRRGVLADNFGRLYGAAHDATGGVS